MTLYNRAGYTLKLLKKENGKEVFQFLSKYKFNNSTALEERSSVRDGLKKLIRNELEIENHTPIGLYSGSELIGICFTELYTPSFNVAKISYIKIDETEYKTLGPQVLFNFLMNILYKEIRITFPNNILDKFGKVARVYPKIIHLSSFRDDYKERLKKYFEEN